MPTPEEEQEQREALALVPIADRIFRHIREQLPAGQEFGLFVLLPHPTDPKAEGRILALTTNRKRVGFAVAQWFVHTDGGQDPEARGGGAIG
jgi:hypothetical protein